MYTFLVYAQHLAPNMRIPYRRQQWQAVQFKISQHL